MGAGAQVDPYAGVGTPVGAPAPPQAATDPYAGIGAPVGAPAQATSASAPPQTAAPPSLGSQVMDAVKGTPGTPGSLPNWVPNPMQTAIGLVKGGMKTVAGILNILNDTNNKILAAGQDNPPAPPTPAPGQSTPTAPATPPVTPIKNHVQRAADWLNANAQDHGVWQHIGDFGENIIELMTPEALGELAKAPEALEAVKAAGAATKAETLADAAKVAKQLELMPRLKALVGLGLATAAKGAAEQGAQTFVKTGGDEDEAAKAALAGAATSGVLRAAGEGFSALGNSSAAKTAAQGALDTLTETRQAAAQGIVKNTIGDTAKTVIGKINEGLAGSPDFTPINPAEIAGRSNTYGQLADATRESVQPIIDKLDDASGGEIGKLQKLRSKAMKANNPEGVEDADRSIAQLINDHKDAVTPQEYSTWRAAYKDSKTLDRIHQAVEGSFNRISEEFASDPEASPRLLRSGNEEGGSLQYNLGKLLDQRDMAARVRKVLGYDGIANLYRASNLVSKPSLRAATANLAAEVAKNFPQEVPNLVKGATGSLGAAAGGYVAKTLGVPWYVGSGVGAAAGGALPDGTMYVLNKMVTSPKIGLLMDYAVRNNVSPKIAATAIAQAIRQENQPQQQDQPQ